jgi:hypothetical protein
MILSEFQLVIVGLVASVLVQIVRFIGDKTGKPVSNVVIQWLVFAISLGLGAWWGVFEFPVFPGFGGPDALLGIVDFVAALVALVGQLLGVAFVVYNVLLKKVFDAIEPLKL